LGVCCPVDDTSDPYIELVGHRLAFWRNGVSLLFSILKVINKKPINKFQGLQDIGYGITHGIVGVWI
jgi:hypothetical protein